MATKTTSSIYVTNKISRQFTRVKLSDVNFKCSVGVLRNQVASSINVPANEIELVYCGRRLDDKLIPENYGIEENCTVFVLKKQSETKPEIPEKPNSEGIQQLMTALRQALLLNPGTRGMAEITRMVSDPNVLETITSATPGLEDDPVALAFLQTPQLLPSITDLDTVNKILEKHPSLAQAAMHVATLLNEQATKERFTSGAGGSGSYSLDQMSDDDDIFGQDESGSSSNGEGASITPNQLAAALAAASRGATAHTQSPSQASTSGGITSDFFQMAMQQALQSSTTGGSGTPNDSTTRGSDQELTRESLQSQIQHLSEMGITDTDAAFHALRASGGDVQLALSILFGEN